MERREDSRREEGEERMEDSEERIARGRREKREEGDVGDCPCAPFDRADSPPGSMVTEGRCSPQASILWQ
jgi:hypothetical protein